MSRSRTSLGRVPAYVLDNFAYMAYVQAEPGGRAVRDLVENAQAGHLSLHMCAVNAAEALYVLWRSEGEVRARSAIANLSQLGITVHDATLELSLHAAAIKAEHAVALGDCFAAALAQKLNATLVTGDPEFRKLGKLVKVKWL